jgi:hypothetical protein
VSERWPVVGDGGWYGRPEAVGDVVGPVATLDEVVWFAMAGLAILVVGDRLVAMTRPYAPAIGQPPEGEADWHIVDGTKYGSDPDGASVEGLVAVDRYVAASREAEGDSLNGGGEFVVAVFSGVDREVDNFGVGWILVLLGVGAGAIYHQLNVVVFVEVLAGDLLAVADDDPAAHPERSSKLVDLHEGGWLSLSWWIPYGLGRAIVVCPERWVNGLG